MEARKENAQRGQHAAHSRGSTALMRMRYSITDTYTHCEQTQCRGRAAYFSPASPGHTAPGARIDDR